MFLSNIVAFDFVYRLAAYAEVLIWQFLDGGGEELFRDMGYLGGCCCQSSFFCSEVNAPLSTDMYGIISQIFYIGVIILFRSLYEAGYILQVWPHSV